MIVLPSKGRPDLLMRFIKAYAVTGAILPVYLVLDEADASRYDHVILPENWKRCTSPEGTPLGGIFNMIFSAFPNEEYYAMVADDLLPETPFWDVALKESCLPDKIAWGNDGIQNEKLPTHPFIGGDLVRKMGWWSPPHIQHWFVDNAWKSIADALNCGVYLDQVKMNHCHPANGKRERDRTDDGQPSHFADQGAYTEFMANDFPKMIERIKKSP